MKVTLYRAPQRMTELSPQEICEQALQDLSSLIEVWRSHPEDEPDPGFPDPTAVGLVDWVKEKRRDLFHISEVPDMMSYLRADESSHFRQGDAEDELFFLDHLRGAKSMLEELYQLFDDEPAIVVRLEI